MKSRTVPNADPCAKCGYCCSKTICGYGKDNGDGNCCFLRIEDKKIGTFSCGIKDVIMAREEGSNIPMFDEYCSSSFMNDVRNEVIIKMKGSQNE